jgi:hypothetical protein
VDHWELGPHEPWDVETDAHEPSTAQRAFAAYEDAWSERDRTGRTSVELLVAALRARRVPAAEYAEGTRLRATLLGSWDRGRRPRRMHGVIVRYRLSSTLDEVRALFGDDTPQPMRLPRDLVPARKAGPIDDVSLPFTPSGTFGARVRGWYEAVDDDERERAIPVWLDTSPRPEHVPVMVGADLAGHTELPTWAHALLVDAAHKGRRVVATGDLWVKRRKGDTWRVDAISVELPHRG